MTDLHTFAQFLLKGIDRKTREYVQFLFIKECQVQGTAQHTCTIKINPWPDKH